jgi:hypothetical protein
VASVFNRPKLFLAVRGSMSELLAVKRLAATVYLKNRLARAYATKDFLIIA